MRSTTAQIVISADDAKTLAIRTWKAQTEAFLLAALLNCEVYWHVQSDVSAVSFNGNACVHVVHHFITFPRDDTFVKLKDCDWLENVYPVAYELMNNNSFYTATNALWSYRMTPRPSTQLAVLWSGIESLFGIDHELVFRIGLLVSRMLETGAEGQRRVKRLYGARSKAVHEGKVKDVKVIDETACLLHELIGKCVELRHVPSEQELLFS